MAIAYLDEHDDATRTAALVESTGRRCLRFPGDLADAQQFQSVVTQTAAALGGLDILVNNVAYQNPTEKFTDINTDNHGDRRSRPIDSYFTGNQGCPRGLCPTAGPSSRVRNRPPRNGMPCAASRRPSNGTTPSRCCTATKRSLMPTARRWNQTHSGRSKNAQHSERQEDQTSRTRRRRIDCPTVQFYRYGDIAGYYLVWTPKVFGDADDTPTSLSSELATSAQHMPPVWPNSATRYSASTWMWRSSPNSRPASFHSTNPSRTGLTAQHRRWQVAVHVLVRRSRRVRQGPFRCGRYSAEERGVRSSSGSMSTP